MAVSNLQSYAIASIYVNTPDSGTKLLAEEASMTLDVNTNSNPVFTVQKGYSGESPGAGVTELSIENAVPAPEFEFDPTPYMVDLLPVSFIIFMANHIYSFSGIIYNSSWQHGVNQAAKLSFKTRGSISKWSE